jgi:hypothetical protein
MKVRLAFAGLFALASAIPGVTFAHHSTEALFDRSRTVEFIGILSKVDIINPHSWWRFDEYRADGTYVREWMVEGGAPSQIRRAIIEGFGSLEFETGKKYTVKVNPGRANEADGYLRSLVFPDGTVFTCC